MRPYRSIIRIYPTLVREHGKESEGRTPRADVPTADAMRAKEQLEKLSDLRFVASFFPLADVSENT